MGYGAGNLAVNYGHPGRWAQITILKSLHLRQLHRRNILGPLKAKIKLKITTQGNLIPLSAQSKTYILGQARKNQKPKIKYQNSRTCYDTFYEILAFI